MTEMIDSTTMTGGGAPITDNDLMAFVETSFPSPEEITVNAADWPSNRMNLELFRLGHRKLQDICIPSSHDAGMVVRSYGTHTKFGTPGVTITQTKSIKEQLELGIRHFDLRFDMAGGQFFCGHYTEIPRPGVADTLSWVLIPPVVAAIGLAMKTIFPTWEGACGESLSSIILTVNDFLRTHNELVMLDISGWGAFYVDNPNGKRFEPDDRRKLYDQLQGIEKLFKPSDPNKKLYEYTLGGLVGKCVIINNDHGQPNLQQNHKSIFPRSSWWETPDKVFYLSQQFSDGGNVAAVISDKFGSPGASSLLLALKVLPSTPEITDMIRWLERGTAGYPIIDDARSRNQLYLQERIPVDMFRVEGRPARMLVADAIEDQLLVSKVININKARFPG